jgi:hypothetical protein
MRTMQTLADRMRGRASTLQTETPRRRGHQTTAAAALKGCPTYVWMPLFASMLAAGGCSDGCRSRPPEVAETTYRQAVVAFHTGLAALQTSQEVLARSEFDRVISLVPHEPAAWADVGLLLLRQQEIDQAMERLQKAADLAPDNADIQRLLALAAGRRGDLPTAVSHWKRALAIAPEDPKAAFAMAVDLERQGGEANEAEAQRTLDALAARTGNLVVQLELARLAAKRQDAAALQRALATLEKIAATWPDDIRQRLQAVRQAAERDLPLAGRQIAFLKNLLMRLPDYRRSLALVSTPREEVGEPITEFIVLPNPRPDAAPPDTALSFVVQGATTAAAGVQGWAGVLSMTGEGVPIVAGSDGRTLRLLPSGGANLVVVAPDAELADQTAGPEGVLPADLNYDYRTDLVLTSPRGVRILRQTDHRRFANVTAAARLPAAVLSAPAIGAWAADVDTDGDLDVVVAATQGPPHVLRNNGDGTFAVTTPFAAATSVRGFAWADLNGEGVPDAAFLQENGRVRVFLNVRGGTFRERPLPEGFPEAVAVAAAEVSGDAIMDLVALTSTGVIIRLSQREDGGGWTQAEVARAKPPAGLRVGAARLLVADLDNNAASDFVLAGPAASHVLLAAPDRTYHTLGSPVAMDVRAAADIDGNGRLELIGLTGDGRVATAASRGEKVYHWQAIRPRAASVTGDQRINSFGIGGEIEVRTGVHVQRMLITSPIVHVGLGEASGSEVTRLLWPNGTLQSEFNLGSDAAIEATQRLKGSCPWLFAWDGREMRFVTDVLWRSPLGLRINSQDTADVLMTEDRVKVRADQLAARDGAYDLRITAELWETHFFDLVSLLVVDHPAGTEVWLDERFAVPPPKTDLIVTGPVQPFAAVLDDSGRDVAPIAALRDDRHLDFAGRGAYQGVTRDHYVEVELPASAPRSGPLWLVAHGWIHPTDSSVNVAISQGTHRRPRGVSLQVANAAGRFRTVTGDLGFPAGKDKTILIDLAGHLPSSGRRRIRLATNMEIFWDRLGWAIGRPDVTLSPVRLVPHAADLRYRGYSVTEQKDPGSPERPRYLLEGTAPRWRDLEGYHTRFGDVRPLLLEVDDRYVIMNAGDELRLRFPAPATAAAGMVRDFVMISDGWEKDGDFNTTFSRTVLPLPAHDSGRYDRAPARLEDDPVYVKHPQDFVQYHTRYVTPDRVRDALAQPARDSGK